MTTTLIGVGIGLAAFLLILGLLIGAARRRLRRTIRCKCRGRKKVFGPASANFFGWKSKGGKQIRGNGALVLLADELWFGMLLPQRDLSIPLKDITAVTFPRSHCGKSILRRLLCLTVISKGVEDSVAWYVRDREQWKTAIDNALGQTSPGTRRSSGT